jgi:hypothetical protein
VWVIRAPTLVEEIEQKKTAGEQNFGRALEEGATLEAAVVRQEHTARKDRTGLRTQFSQPKAIADLEARSGNCFGGGGAEHLATDIHADAPCKGGEQLGEHQAGAATGVDEAALPTITAATGDAPERLSQEAGIGIVIIEIASRASQGAVPFRCALVPASGDGS